MLRSGKYEKHYQIDPKDSWMLAAAKKNLPLVVPGWEDSTLGNMYAAALIRGDPERPAHTVRSGIEYMTWLADFYTRTTEEKARWACSRLAVASRAIFRFASCRCCIRIWAAPALPLWGYFCQISDSTTSYGSYSGAVPNEKITWGKLGVDTPKFHLESDATIVAPLIFAAYTGW